MTCKDCIHNEVCHMREICNDIEEQIKELGCMDFIARADVVKVRHGRKIIHKRHRGFYSIECPICEGKFPSNKPYTEEIEYCSECGKRLDDTFQNFCPNCGAKMDGGKNND